MNFLEMSRKFLEMSMNCLRFANPAEALGGRHLEAERHGGLEARRLQYVDISKLHGSFYGFLGTSIHNLMRQ